MPKGPGHVLHLVAVDTPDVSGRELLALVGQLKGRYHHAVWMCGRGAVPRPLGRCDLRVHVPLDWEPVAAWGIGHAVDRLSPPPDAVHVWSRRIAKWVTARLASRRRLIIEVEPGPNAGDFVDWPVDGRSVDLPTYVCRTEASRRALLGRGVLKRQCALIAPRPAPRTDSRQERVRVRESLGIGSDEQLVVVLPPVRRDTGAFIAAWAVLVAQKARPTLRLAVPGDGRETYRVRRLVRACRHEWVARFVDGRVSLEQLVAASDVGVYLPRSDASRMTAELALEMGCPVVSTLPAVGGSGPARLVHCDRRDPETVAAAVLRAAEQGELPWQSARDDAGGVPAAYESLYEAGR